MLNQFKACFKRKNKLKANTNMATDDAKHQLADQFERMFDILAHHYGPYGKYAMLIDPVDPLREPIHTKDGINIIRSLQYADPIFNVAQRTLARIGKRVEAEVGDGTTSAMMICAGLYQRLAKKMHKMPMYTMEDIRRAQVQILDALDTLATLNNLSFDKFMKYLGKNDSNKDSKVCRATEKFLRGALARAQAHISSHGDKELCDVIEKIYAESNSEMLKYVIFERCSVETDKRFEIVDPKGQFEIKVRVPDKRCFDYATGKFKVKTNDRLVVLNEALRHADPKQLDIFEKFLKDDTRRTVVLCHSAIDRETWDLLMMRFAEQPECLAVFTYDMPRHQTLAVNDVSMVNITSQRLPIDGLLSASAPAFFVYENASISHDNNMLYLSNMFERDAEGFNVNITCKEMTAAKTMRDILTERNAALEADDVSTSNTDELSSNRGMLNRLVAGAQRRVRIGGYAYDNVASYDVLMDTMCAIARLFEHGIAPANNRNLALLAKDLRIVKHWNATPEHSLSTASIKFIELFGECLQETMIDVYQHTFGYKRGMPAPFDAFVNAPLDVCNLASVYTFDELKQAYELYGTATFASLVDRKLTDGSDNIAHVAAIQPGNTDRVIIERFFEVFSKYLFTDTMILNNLIVEKE